jgi:hypothetical protein
MDYNDFFEPSGFEQQVDDLKESIRQSVKAEIQDELQRLREENAQLQEVKQRSQR